MQALVERIINEQESIKIPVRLRDGKQIGFLTPVTKSALADDELIGRLTDWRNSMRTCFLTQAAVSPETTRAFLANSLFKDSTRMLFIVHSLNQPIGTLGIKLAPPWVHGAGPSIAERAGHRLAELANLLLGVRDGHPMLMYHGELALIDWVFRVLDIDLVWTAVPSDNRLALTLHKSAGFKQTERIPLFRHMKNGEPHMVPGEPGAESPDGLYAQRIELDRSDFLARQQAALTTVTSEAAASRAVNSMPAHAEPVEPIAQAV
jgi:hypothetical protein